MKYKTTLYYVNPALPSAASIMCHKCIGMNTVGSMLWRLMNYTANLFTAKTAGFHCVRFLTVISLYFLQSLSACSGSLQLRWRVSEACIFCSLIPAVVKVRFLLSLRSITWIFAVYDCILWSRTTNFFKVRDLNFLKSYTNTFCCLTTSNTSIKWK